MTKELFVELSEMKELCDKIRELLSDKKNMVLSTEYTALQHLIRMVENPLLYRRFLKLEKEFIEMRYEQYKEWKKKREKILAEKAKND